MRLLLTILSALSALVSCDNPAALQTAIGAAAGSEGNQKTEYVADGNSAKASRADSDDDGETMGKSVAYELPAIGKNDFIIRHTGYTLRYNKKHNTPDWSAWCLKAKHTYGGVERSGKFWADPAVPAAYRVYYYDYKDSGYDRGHMCPAGDMKWSEKAMHDCFYMSNICPQTGALNSGAWNKLESKCREWARESGWLYIVCGPVWKRGVRHEQIGINHAIDVPEGFFKAVLSLCKGHEQAVGFYFRNDESSQSYRTALVSVDEIERMTGLDLFAALPDNIEAHLEAKCEAWK